MQMPDKIAESMVKAYLSGILLQNRCIYGMSFRQWIGVEEQPNEYYIKTTKH